MSYEKSYQDHYRWMDEAVSQRIEPLAKTLLGEPTFKKYTEWRYGTNGSLLVHIEGPKQGRFVDFEAGTQGSSLDLITRQTGYTGTALSRWVKSWLGEVQPKRPPPSWTPIFPVPFNTLEPEILRWPLNYMLQNRQETGRYTYRDLEGNLLGYVVRLEALKKGEGPAKVTPMLTFCKNEFGQQFWRWKGFGENRFPYGAEKLKEVGKPILIVEGEKNSECSASDFY